MFMEKLVRETERLSLICSMLDTMRRATGTAMRAAGPRRSAC